MNETLYRIVSWGFQELIWGGDLLGADNLPETGPAIIVSNHHDALGPIAIGGSVPLYLHAWIHASTMDPILAPEYIRTDFVEPQLHIPLPFSHLVSEAISKIHVPLLRAAGGIPIYHTPEGFQETFRITLDLLAQGKFILIFPEDPTLPLDLRYNMRPFLKGFTRLGEMYYERTRGILPFVPMAVHGESRTVRVGRAIRYNPLVNPANERQRLKDVLEQSIHSLLTDASLEQVLRLPLPS